MSHVGERVLLVTELVKHNVENHLEGVL